MLIMWHPFGIWYSSATSAGYQAPIAYRVHKYIVFFYDYFFLSLSWFTGRINWGVYCIIPLLFPYILLMYHIRVLDCYRYCTTNTVDSLDISTESSGLLQPLIIICHEASWNDLPISCLQLEVRPDKALYWPCGVASAYKGLSNPSTHAKNLMKKGKSGYQVVTWHSDPPPLPSLPLKTNPDQPRPFPHNPAFLTHLEIF